MIKNIIFDMNDVLLKGHAYSVLDSLSISNTHYELLKKEFFSDFEKLDLGLMSIDEKLSFVSFDLNEELRFFLLNYYKYRVFNYKLLDYIKMLKKKDYNVYILSDNNKEAIDYYKSLDIFKDIDGWVVSYEYSTLKKDKKLFNIILDKYKLNAYECLYIDDRKVNVDIASFLGMKSIRYSFSNDDVTTLINKINKLLK